MYCNIIELKLTGHPVIVYFMHAAPEEAAHRERHRVRGVPRGERHQLLAGLHQEPLPPHLHRRQVSQSLSVSLFCSQFCHIRFRGRVFLKFRWLPKRSRWRNTRKTSSTARLVSYQREREREREREIIFRFPRLFLNCESWDVFLLVMTFFFSEHFPWKWTLWLLWLFSMCTFWPFHCLIH